MDKSAWLEQVRLLERRRLIICIPLALAYLIVYFHRLAAGVVSDSLMRDFGIERASELGLLSSIYFYTYAACQMPAGVVADFYGPRRTITIAIAVAGIGALAFGWAPNLFWLYGARFVVGLGVAFVYINIIKIFAEWFRMREFGTMCGISSFIGNAGSVLAATPLALLVENVGWRVSFYLIGIVTLVIAAYCWLTVRNQPANCGLLAIAALEEYEGIIMAKQLPAAGVLESVRTVMGNVYTWPPFLVGACLYGVFMGFGGIWGVPYFMQIYGMSRVDAANHLVAVFVGYMLFGPLWGYLSDRWCTRRQPFIGGTVLALAAWLGLTLWNQAMPPFWTLYPFCFLLGAGTSVTTLTLACAKEVNPSNMTGIATGVVNMGPFIGAALVQPGFGWVLDQYWAGALVAGVKLYPLMAFERAFWLCAAILLAAFVVVLFTKETNCSNVAGKIGRGIELN